MIHGFKTIVRPVTSFTLLTLTRQLSATTTQLSRGSYERQGRDRDTTIARHWSPIWHLSNSGRRSQSRLIPRFVNQAQEEKTRDRSRGMIQLVNHTYAKNSTLVGVHFGAARATAKFPYKYRN